MYNEFLVINDVLSNFILVKNNYDKIIHNIQKIKGSDENKYICLNFYDFNILVDQCKNQNAIYKLLDYNFFKEISEHKRKLYFCGYFNMKKAIFFPSELIYLMPPIKLGVHVKKSLINKFKKKGIILEITNNKAKAPITWFSLKNY